MGYSTVTLETRKMIKIGLLSSLFVGLLFGCASTKLEIIMEYDIAAIDRIWIEYQESVNAGDAERWGALWMEDGIQMQPVHGEFLIL